MTRCLLVTTVLAAIVALCCFGALGLPARAQAQDGLEVSLALTSDADWRDRSIADLEFLPVVDDAVHMRPGDKATLLIFVSNLPSDESGRARLLCDLTLTLPDGEALPLFKEMLCLDLPVQQGETFRTALFLNLEIEPDDPPSAFEVGVGVTDAAGGRRFPASLNVVLEEAR